MEIKTKYNIGDTLFFLTPKATKVSSSIVRGIKTEYRQVAGESTVVGTTTYLMSMDDDNRVTIPLDEGLAFKSKDELLQYL